MTSSSNITTSTHNNPLLLFFLKTRDDGTTATATLPKPAIIAATRSHRPIDLDFPFLTQESDPDIVGIRNGLVCIRVSQFGKPLFLCNPATKQFRRILGYKWWDERDAKLKRVTFGFGFHPSAKDYKLVRIAYYSCFDARVIVRAEVFSVRTMDYKLTFPSGMATAVLINGFHNQGEKMARKQVRGFMKVFSVSFLWGFFQWFYSGKDICGFTQFPTFGLRAWKNTFYFDFSMTYVGTGTICPHIVNLSTLLGAVLSWGVMWPLLANFKGLWFPSTIPESSMKSLNGYKSVDILKQNEVFIRESIPLWVGASGYILFTVISVIVIPFIFPEVKWYYVIMSYLLAPSLAFCNAYGAGLTDINMSYNYGKVGLFALAALAGKQHGVVAGLAGCGLMKSVISVSCILMQDLKTGHLTLTSPRTMLVSQAIGTAIGCVVSHLCFLLFYKAFDVGNPNGEYKAPYAVIYRNIAILGVQGFSTLPYHCLQLCHGFFAFAVGINLVKDFSPPRIGKWMPLPMAMAVPFLVGAYFSTDMCVGTLIVFVWHKLNPKKAELMVPVVASSLICGEGLWTLPESILSLAGVNPPMCMKFVSS
ncbi:hypothetical protein ACSBR2_041354 [Camellia fascicularis]